MPRLLHQTWKTKTLPATCLPYVKAWQALHPAWEHVLWSDAENRSLIERYYPWFLRTYNSYPYDIQRADAIRYFILHRYGGLYADLDYEPFEAFDAACATKRALFVERYAGGISNFLMFAGERRSIWERIIRSLAPSHEQTHYRPAAYAEQVLNTTGPMFLWKVIGTTGLRRSCGVFSACEYDPYDRFALSLPPAKVRRRLRALKGLGRPSRAASGEPAWPEALQQRLRLCKGVHWRVATWLKSAPG